MRTALRLGLQLLPALALLGIWQGIISRRPDLEFYIGSPCGVFRELSGLYQHGRLLYHTGVTTMEAVLGFASGSILGTAVGLAFWASQRVFEVARPYLIALGAMPAFALGPILIFWFGTGLWSKVVLGFLCTFFVAVAQAHTGASEVDPNLLRLAQAFRAKRMKIYRHIVIPSAVIWVLAGIRLNIGMALLGAFVGEFIASKAGLGHLIITAEGLYNVNQIWAGIVCVMGLAVFFTVCTIPVEKWAKRWT